MTTIFFIVYIWVGTGMVQGMTGGHMDIPAILHDAPSATTQSTTEADSKRSAQ